MPSLLTAVFAVSILVSAAVEATAQQGPPKASFLLRSTKAPSLNGYYFAGVNKTKGGSPYQAYVTNVKSEAAILRFNKFGRVVLDSQKLILAAYSETGPLIYAPVSQIDNPPYYTVPECYFRTDGPHGSEFGRFACEAPSNPLEHIYVCQNDKSLGYYYDNYDGAGGFCRRGVCGPGQGRTLCPTFLPEFIE